MRVQSRSEGGSALMLVPAGVLILLILGSLSVDAAIAFLASRELQNATAATANDLATIAISPDALQTGERAVPDQRSASELAHQRLDGYEIAGLVVRPEDVAVFVDVADRTITVEVAGEVPYLFARGIPGARHSAVVRARSTASVVSGSGP